MDVDHINSQVKSWIYQDCLEKPSEVVLVRDCMDGGLGMFHVRLRSLALLIRSFLETAVNPCFRHSLLHEILFRYHVLGEDSIPDPGYLPYYDKEFFQTIKHYKETSPMNIAVMTTKQWYRALLEDRILMQPTELISTPVLHPVRVESLLPDNDWKTTWRLLRTKGLNSQQSSFLFKLLHQLLPTQDRIGRITREARACKKCHHETDDLLHALLLCPDSRATADKLLGYVQVVVPDISPDRLLLLDFGTELGEADILPVLSIVSTGLSYIWQARAEKKRPTQHKMRAEIEAEISILRKTRYCAMTDRMLEIIV